MRREQRLFGVPGPFCGAGSLSLLRVSPPSRLRFFFRFHRRAARFPLRTSAHRRSPSPSLTLNPEGNEGISAKHHGSRSYLAERSLRVRHRCRSLDGLPGLGPASTVIHGSSGVPEGGWIPPGGYPVPDGSAFGKASRSGSHHVARCTGEEMASSEGLRRSSLVPAPGCSFSKAFQSPLSLQISLAARVMHRRWHPSPHGEEPLSPRSPRTAFAARFLEALPHSQVYLAAGHSFAERVQDPIGFRLLRGSRPLRIRGSLGASCLPLTRGPRPRSRACRAPRFRPASRLGVPRGTHNYTRFEYVCKHFLQISLSFFCRYIVSKFSNFFDISFFRVKNRFLYSYARVFSL